MEDVFGLNIINHSVSNYLNDQEILATYHPKHILNHISNNNANGMDVDDMQDTSPTSNQYTNINYNSISQVHKLSQN